DLPGVAPTAWHCPRLDVCPILQAHHRGFHNDPAGSTLTAGTTGQPAARARERERLGRLRSYGPASPRPLRRGIELAPPGERELSAPHHNLSRVATPPTPYGDQRTL